MTKKKKGELEQKKKKEKKNNNNNNSPMCCLHEQPQKKKKKKRKPVLPDDVELGRSAPFFIAHHYARLCKTPPVCDGKRELTFFFCYLAYILTF